MASNHMALEPEMGTDGGKIVSGCFNDFVIWGYVICYPLKWRLG